MIIGDDGKGGITGIVTSANPHDASSLHSNVGAASCRARRSRRCSRASWRWRANPAGTASWDAAGAPRRRRAPAPENTARVQVLTEGEIRAAIVRNFAGARVGDSIDIAMFYLSERERDPGAARRREARRGGARASSIPTRTRSAAPRTASRTARSPPSSPPRPTAPSRCAGSARTASSSTPSWWRCAPPRNSGSRWARRTSRAATSDDYNLEANIAASVPLNAEIAAQITRLVRIAVDQPRPAGPRIHRGIRHLRRSVAGHATGCIA